MAISVHNETFPLYFINWYRPPIFQICNAKYFQLIRLGNFESIAFPFKLLSVKSSANCNLLKVMNVQIQDNTK